MSVTVILPPESVAELVAGLLPEMRACVKEAVAEVLEIDDLTPEQVSKIVGRSTRTLADLRSRGEGPDYTGGGRGVPVRYSHASVRRWMDEQKGRRS